MPRDVRMTAVCRGIKLPHSFCKPANGAGTSDGPARTGRQSLASASVITRNASEIC
jgi:hypothetical protein